MVAVVTDSAANLPGETARELRIGIVPMYLKLGDQVYRDGADLTPRDFYTRLAAGEEAASTSTPSPGDFLAAFEEAGQQEVVCVTIASTMSGANHEASMAAERFGGRVVVVDSKNASMGQGFVALEAARLAAQGASLDEVAARASDVADRVELLATVDTFEYLQRSGRVRKLQAYAATLLDIKPVFRFRGGEVSAVARPRTRARALARIVDEAVAAIGDRPAHLGVVHATADGDGAALSARIAERARIVDSVVVEATPVIGAHTGPGLVGAAFFCD